MMEIEIVPILTPYTSEPYALFSHPPTFTQPHTHTHCPRKLLKFPELECTHTLIQ